MLWFCSKCDLVDSRLIESSCARWLTSIHATKDSSPDETKVFSFPGSGGFRWSWSRGVLYWWVKREELPCGEEDQPRDLFVVNMKYGTHCANSAELNSWCGALEAHEAAGNESYCSCTCEWSSNYFLPLAKKCINGSQLLENFGG